MKRKLPALRPAALALAFALWAASAGCSPAAEGEETLVSGRVSFETVDLAGSAVSSDFSPYRLSVLNYWATWCPPCVEEIPLLAKLSDEMNEIQVIGVLIDGVGSDGEANAEAIGAAKKILSDSSALYLNILPDSRMLSSEIAKMQYVPTTLFVNSSGRVVKTLVGSGSRTLEEWKSEVEAALGEPN
jgi:thiol-disulfide isomerase/thioredoxin